VITVWKSVITKDFSAALRPTFHGENRRIPRDSPAKRIIHMTTNTTKPNLKGCPPWPT